MSDQPVIYAAICGTASALITIITEPFKAIVRPITKGRNIEEQTQLSEAVSNYIKPHVPKDNNYISDILRNAGIPEEYVPQGKLEKITNNYVAARILNNAPIVGEDVRVEGLQAIVDYALTDGSMRFDKATERINVHNYFPRNMLFFRPHFFEGYDASRAEVKPEIEKYVNKLVQRQDKERLREFTNLVYNFSSALVGNEDGLLELEKDIFRLENRRGIKYLTNCSETFLKNIGGLFGSMLSMPTVYSS